MFRSRRWDGRVGPGPYVGLVAALLGLALATGGPAGCVAGTVTTGDRPDGGADGARPDTAPVCQSSAECDDGDPCTNDECDRWAGKCVHQSSCCTSAADCDDGQVCTEDVCEGGACKHAPRQGCCEGNADCDDDGCGTVAGPSSMTASNLATGSGLYFVVVDTYGYAAPGDFTLTVTY